MNYSKTKNNGLNSIKYTLIKLLMPKDKNFRRSFLDRMKYQYDLDDEQYNWFLEEFGDEKDEC